MDGRAMGAAELYAPAPDGRVHSASGTLVPRGLVLTAAHEVRLGAEVIARPLGSGDHEGTVVWSGKGRGTMRPWCGCRTWVACRFDTGILDVIEIDPVRRLLDETSHGRYGEWRSGYHNPVRRSPTRFTRGELTSPSIALRDATIG